MHKQLPVKPETHKAIKTLAAEYGATIDDVIQCLITQAAWGRNASSALSKIAMPCAVVKSLVLASPYVTDLDDEREAMRPPGPESQH